MRSLRPFLFLALAASSPAFAFNYVGATCLKEGGGTLDINFGGQIENTGSTTLNVVCPVIVDNPFSLPTDKRVWVTDLSQTTQVCCSWRVKSAGSSYQSGGNDCTPVGDSSPDYMELDPDYLLPITSNGARYLYCSIPPDSGTGKNEIRSFTWDY